jgi:hypothetical protein
MSEFERIVNDMMIAYNSYSPDDEGLELEYDDEWLDDFQGEEEFA